MKIKNYYQSESALNKKLESIAEFHRNNPNLSVGVFEKNKIYKFSANKLYEDEKIKISLIPKPEWASSADGLTVTVLNETEGEIKLNNLTYGIEPIWCIEENDEWTEKQDQELKDSQECGWDNSCTLCGEYECCIQKKNAPLQVMIGWGKSEDGFTCYKPYTVIASAGEYITLVDDNGCKRTLLESNFVPC